MSKSTVRYGRVTLTAKTSIEANPTPPPPVVYQWQKLDEAAKKHHGLPYFNLTSEQRSNVHTILKDQRTADLREARG